MSTQLQVTFSDDMPVAVVEVVNPDLEVVARIMLAPGLSKTVEVNSEDSFLRIHLASGQVVTLKDPGVSSRTVSRASLQLTAYGTPKGSPIESATTNPTKSAHSARAGEKRLTSQTTSPRRRDLASKAASSRVPQPRPIPVPAQQGEFLALGREGAVQVNAVEATEVAGRSRGRSGQVWSLHARPADPPGQLLYRSGTISLRVCLPSTVRRMEIDHAPAAGGGLGLFDLRMRGTSPAADAILCYLQRGDMYSAQAMEEWVEEAASMVLGDDSDPYSGAVGAYLLLRLRRFDRLNEWARELADRFEFLPDGCVLWAWQLMHARPDHAREARTYLLRAADRGLPVYSEGLRLLLDGLQMIGETGESARKHLHAEAGDVVWSAPVTTTVTVASIDGSSAPATSAMRVDVRFVGS